MARLFGAASTDKVGLGSPAALDDLATSGQLMVVCEARRNADGVMVLASKGGGIGSGTGWSFYVNTALAVPGRLHFVVERATALTLCFSDTAFPADLLGVVGVTWDSTQATGDSGVRFFGQGIEFPVSDTGATVAQAGSGAFGADASADMAVGNVVAAAAPWLGDLGWTVVRHKAGSTPYTLDEVRQTQAAILALKAAREGSDALTRGLAMAGADAVLVLEIASDGTCTDHSATGATATLTGTTAGTEQTGWFCPAPETWTDDIEPNHASDESDQTLYAYTSEFARKSFVTTATSFTVWARSTMGFLGDNRVPQIGYLVDGVYTDEIRTAMAATPEYVTGTVTGLSAGSKTITLINGMRASLTGVRPFDGTFLTHVRFNAAATEQTAAVRSNPLVVLGDSHLEGFYTNAAASEGCIQKLRLNLPALYDGVVMYGAGGLSLFAVGADATARQKTADTICAGTPRSILSNLGGNDWANDYFTGVAAYTAALSDMMDKILAGFSGHLYWASMVTFPVGGHEEDEANASGDFIEEYRNAIETTCAAKGSRVTYLELQPVVTVTNFDSDLTHPNTAGHDELYQFFADELNETFGAVAAAPLVAHAPDVTVALSVSESVGAAQLIAHAPAVQAQTGQVSRTLDSAPTIFHAPAVTIVGVRQVRGVGSAGMVARAPGVTVQAGEVSRIVATARMVAHAPAVTVQVGEATRTVASGQVVAHAPGVTATTGAVGRAVGSAYVVVHAPDAFGRITTQQSVAVGAARTVLHAPVARGFSLLVPRPPLTVALDDLRTSVSIDDAASGVTLDGAGTSVDIF